MHINMHTRIFEYIRTHKYLCVITLFTFYVQYFASICTVNGQITDIQIYKCVNIHKYLRMSIYAQQRIAAALPLTQLGLTGHTQR